MVTDGDRQGLRERAERDLEWPRLMQHIGGRALGPVAAERLRGLRPASRWNEA